MSLRFAVLGMLSVRPMSGLVDDGMASRSAVAQEDRPNLYLHRITPSGADALDAWLDSPLDSEVKREPFLARMFFADRLPVPRIAALLESRRREVSDSLAELESIEVPDGRDSLGEILRFATLDNGIAHARAELDWIDTVMNRLKERAS